MTLDQFIALNEEIAALVRSGVPLDQGLAALGDDLSGRLGKAASAVAEQTARGVPLDRAVMDQTVGLPPAYRAVVEAGLKAGRLPAALEAVAGSARRLTETYRTAVTAVSYPLIIIAVVWLAAAALTTVLAPRLAEGFGAMDAPAARFFALLAEIGRWAWWWGPVVPVGAVVLIWLWWTACRRAAMLHGGWPVRMLSAIPWLGRMMRFSRTATYLEILALLIENEMPLDDALALAAETLSNGRSGCEAGPLAGKGDSPLLPERPEGCYAQKGTVPFSGLDAELCLPPLMTWIMRSARREGALLPAVRRGAAAYHRRARRQADLVRNVMPVALTAALGGSVTAAYVFAIFAPYVSLLHHLGNVAGR